MQFKYQFTCTCNLVSVKSMRVTSQLSNMVCSKKKQVRLLRTIRHSLSLISLSLISLSLSLSLSHLSLFLALSLNTSDTSSWYKHDLSSAVSNHIMACVGAQRMFGATDASHSQEVCCFSWDPLRLWRSGATACALRGSAAPRVRAAVVKR